MNLAAVLALGFFLGMRHATDADHVVAVSNIVTRERTLRAAAPIGALWGLGHTLTILLVGGAIILFGIVIPPRLGLGMELSVAIMLVLLGALNVKSVLRDARSIATAHGHPHLRSVQDHAHDEAPYGQGHDHVVHDHAHDEAPYGQGHDHVVHDHAHGRAHLRSVHGHPHDHAHLHSVHDHSAHDHAAHGHSAHGAASQDAAPHGHSHSHSHLFADAAASAPPRSLRPLFVGIVHGLAGSAAVALLVLGAIGDPLWALGYLLVFGIGTIAGMVLITTAIAVPISVAAQKFARFHRALGIATGLASVLLGAFLFYQIGFVDGLFTSQPLWSPH